jgi:hypothetical protein
MATRIFFIQVWGGRFVLLGFKVKEGHDILHGILGRVALFFSYGKGGVFFRGFLPPF